MRTSPTSSVHSSLGKIRGVAWRALRVLVLWMLSGFIILAADDAALDASFTRPPAEFVNRFGKYPSLLRFNDGRPVTTAREWHQRRQEILDDWHTIMGPWPDLLSQPRLEIVSREAREDFTQCRVKVEIAAGQMTDGYLLIPRGEGPFPAVLIPYYEPETSIGQSAQKLRDFGYQLTRRGCVTLSIGSPGGDARRPDRSGAQCQPLSFLAWIAANCHTALAQRPEVDPARIGIIGHSYGGKWAMFGACLYEKFACGVWSDPGIVFDESRPNVNYWEPWYLGMDAAQAQQRKPGVPTAENPRTGAYKRLMAESRDLHELQALMAPRPFLVSGGSEDPPLRWEALNRVNEVYELLGVPTRAAMTNRKDHSPTAESNDQIYAFFTTFLSLQKAGR